MIPYAIPDTVVSQGDVTRLRDAARREETACGSGRLVWRVWGREGEPVVLLHGGSGSWVHWMRNVGALVRAGHVVYVPDLPGFGESSLPPEGFDADSHTEWILSGLEKLLGSSPYDLVGFSFGSLVATFVAVQRPLQVRRLILVGAPSLSELPGARVEIKNWRTFSCAKKVRDAHRHNLGAIMLAGDESVEDYIIDLYSADAEQDRIPQRRLFKTDILLRQMSSVRCPVWGVWGSNDALHRGCMESILAGLSRAPLFQALTLIPFSGHWVQFEAAERFNRTLRAALDVRVTER